MSDLHLPTKTLRTPRSSWLLCCALAVSAAVQPQARASSIADWDQWLENTNSDGSATLDVSTLVLTGPNNGSGLSGTTDFWFNAMASGMVTFHYYYSSYDPIPDLFDDPLYDYAGLLSGTDFVPFSGIVEPLASRLPYVHPITGALLGPGVTGTESGDIQFGDIQMPVVIGQFFGFRVGSEDNLFLPGILTISELNFIPSEEPGLTSLVTETPEPGTWPLLLVAASAAIGIRVRARRASMRKTENA